MGSRHNRKVYEQRVDVGQADVGGGDVFTKLGSVDLEPVSLLHKQRLLEVDRHHLAYASSWVKHHHPDVFLAALLNSQPMGFYAPAQLVGCARRHGVEVRPVCVQASRWDCSLEPAAASTGGFAVRLGLRSVSGFREADGVRLVGVRADQTFASVLDLQRRSGLGVDALTRLARGDAFRALGLTRRHALWEIRALRDATLPLFAAAARPAAVRV